MISTYIVITICFIVIGSKITLVSFVFCVFCDILITGIMHSFGLIGYNVVSLVGPKPGWSVKVTSRCF